MRLVSVFGDSISTYDGFNPDGYAVYYDGERQIANGLNTVYDTWWAKVNQALHAFLCVNNSYSGSKVSGGVFPSASCTERAKLLCNEWGNPDYILVYIGFNDFGNRVAISSGKKKEHNLSFFEDAYEAMLQQIKENCSTSAIVCGTLMRTEIRNRDDWAFPEVYLGIPFEEYNEAIRRVCKRQGCYLAELSRNGARYETLDGTHPTASGHSVIANEWIKELVRLGLLQP